MPPEEPSLAKLAEHALVKVDVSMNLRGDDAERTDRMSADDAVQEGLDAADDLENAPGGDEVRDGREM